jgi:hypothetical protein
MCGSFHNVIFFIIALLDIRNNWGRIPRRLLAIFGG